MEKSAIFIFFVITLSLAALIQPDHLNKMWQDQPALSEENQALVDSLKALAASLPNVTSEIQWNRVVMQEPVTTTKAPSPHRDHGFLQRPPTMVTNTPVLENGTGCSNLFFSHRDLVKELEKLICKARAHTKRHHKSEKLEKLENLDHHRNLLYLRDFHIARGKKQEVYFNPSASEIVMGLEGIKLMSLRDFVAWIKVQAKLVEIALSVEETLRPFYNLRYHNFQPSNRVPTDTFEVETFEVVEKERIRV